MLALKDTWSRFFPNPTYYGWAIVGAGFLASALSSPGQSFLIALYLDPVMADVGLTRVEISTLYAVATLLAAACLPFIGGIADRVSSRRFLGGVLALLALSLVLLSQARSVAALAGAFFLLRLLAQGAIGLGTITATVRWFRAYRGRALAVVTLGYAFGQLVYPGVVYALVGGLGWRGSLLLMAAVYLLIAPIIALLHRERRPDREPLDGGTVPAPTAGTAGISSPEPSFSLRQAAAVPVFWGLLFCVAVPPLVFTAVIFHQVAIFEGAGWGGGLVPAALMAMALAAVVGTYATGLVLERFPSRLGLSASLLLTAVGIAAILLPLPAFAGAMLYGVLFGLGSGVNATANSIVWPDYFGIQALGALKGVVTAVRNGATALGPPIAALLFVASGSFSLGLVVFILLSLVSAGAALGMTRPDLAGRSGSVLQRLLRPAATRRERRRAA